MYKRQPGALASHVVGYMVESEGKGASGVEAAFDRTLSLGCLLYTSISSTTAASSPSGVKFHLPSIIPDSYTHLDAQVQIQRLAGTDRSNLAADIQRLTQMAQPTAVDGYIAPF